MPVSTHSKVCTDLLRRELGNGEVTTSKQAYRIIGLLATCVVSSAEDAIVMAKEIYGNGEPGGLKLEVSKINDKIDVIYDYIEEERGKSAARVGNTSFDRFLKWSIDKVVPSLVVSAFLAVGNLIFFVSAFILALANGWVSIQ